MKKGNILAAFAVALAMAGLVRAADDFTDENIPDQHYLSWGDKSVLIYGDASSGNEYFRVQVSGSDYAHLDSTGLGLNDITPSYRLDVNGTARVTGAVTLDSTLSVTGAATFISKVPDTDEMDAGDTITATGACGGLVRIKSRTHAAMTTSTTATFTTPTTALKGCQLDVINIGSQNITLDDNDVFPVAADIVLQQEYSVRVVSDGSVWYLIGTMTNNI